MFPVPSSGGRDLFQLLPRESGTTSWSFRRMGCFLFLPQEGGTSSSSFLRRTGPPPGLSSGGQDLFPLLPQEGGIASPEHKPTGATGEQLPGPESTDPQPPSWQPRSALGLSDVRSCARPGDRDPL